MARRAVGDNGHVRDTISGMATRASIAELRKYAVLNVDAAKTIAMVWLERARLHNAILFGLPEVDDRYHVWRVNTFANQGDTA
jgi:hypothetical protein